MPADVDVLVVGAGPTGLALACALQSFDTRFRVVDKQLDRVHESRAMAVQARTLEVLAALGVTDEMVKCGNRGVLLQMHSGRRVAAARLFDIGIEDTAYPYILFLSQAETERIFEDHLAARGQHVERGVELIEMSTLADAVRCVLRHGDGHREEIFARHVVGCDGAHSTVRAQAGIPFVGRPYPQTFVLADLDADGVEAGRVYAFLSAEGILFLFPLGEPAPWRLLTMRPGTDRTPPGAPIELVDVQEICDRYTDGRVRLRDPVWMTNFGLQLRGAAHYRAGPVFLAGDAAHIHSPAGAQGMNTGIQDAVNLAWKLAFGTGELLDTYQAERAPVGRRVLRLSDRAFQVATASNPVLRFVRTRLVDRIFPLVLRIRPARAYGFRAVSELTINYRNSRACLDGPGAPRRGPKAGDRLPDAPLSNDGTPTSLHAVTGAPGFHLLLSGPPPAWTHPAGVPRGVAVHRLDRRDAVALRRLGLRPGQVVHHLIRPDGYIGYRAAGTDLSGVREYLDRWISLEGRP